MMARSCRTVRRQLSAFHDGELPVGDQIAVQAHLRECPACAADAREMDDLGSLLRTGALSAQVESDVWGGLPSIVVSRLKAEDAESISGWTGRVFDDLHLVWAAVGATGATVACVALIFIIFFYAITNPAGSNRNPMIVDSRMSLPSASTDMFPVAGSSEEEGLVVALNAVVTREGRVTNIEVIKDREKAVSDAERKEVLNLLDAISKARFQPARCAGSPVPVAVNMVWLYASLTVKAKMPEVQVLQPQPPKPSRSTISTIIERAVRRTDVLSA